MALVTDSSLLTVTVVETMLGNNNTGTRLTKHKVTQIIDLFIGCMLCHKLLLTFVWLLMLATLSRQASTVK